MAFQKIKIATILTILMTSLGIAPVFSMCAWSGINAYPFSTYINQNNLIIIEGYGASQPIIDSLNIGYPVYLEADEHKVSLIIKEKYKGMFRLTQAILQPTERLKEGKTYVLKIDNLNEEDHDLTKWNNELKKAEALQWTVKAGVDTECPIWKKNPKVIDTSVNWYGCGPATKVIFSSGIEDNSPTWVKTEMIDLKTNESNTYYLQVEEDGKIYVGHGMCSGAFEFESSNTYKVRFSLMDGSGNTDHKWTDWLTFDSPYDNQN